MSIGSHYIELRLHCDIKKIKNKSIINVEELFEESDLTINSSKENNINIIVIKGGPGCGKSTMMTKFSYEWAKNLEKKKKENPNNCC